MITEFTEDDYSFNLHLQAENAEEASLLARYALNAKRKTKLKIWADGRTIRANVTTEKSKNTTTDLKNSLI